MELFFLILIATVIASGGAFLILSAWLDRKLSAMEAGLLLVGLLGVLIAGIQVPEFGAVGLAAAVIGTAGVCWALSRRAEQDLGRSLDEEDIAKYTAAMDFDPKNVAAQSLLADTYRRMGRVELALEEYKAAVRLDPSLRPEHHWIRQLEAELERRGRKEMSCPRCGRPRRAGEQVCPECDRSYSSMETATHSLRTASHGRKLTWAAGAAAAGIGLALAAMAAPGVMGWLASGAFFVGAAAALAVAIRLRRRTG